MSQVDREEFADGGFVFDDKDSGCHGAKIMKVA
jgi:hypothetical protein